MVKVKQLDFDTFETLIIYKSLIDPIYMGTVIDHLKPEYFNDSDIKEIVSIITSFYHKHNCAPTPTEIKNYLTTDQLRQSFTKIVNNFKTIDKNLNKKELYDNTESFFKNKGTQKTLMEYIENHDKGKLDLTDILEKFTKACNISLTHEMGLNYFKDFEKIITEINRNETYISSGYKWIDDKLGGGFIEEGKALYIFCGQTNVGKSIVLGNIATNICSQGKTVLLISLEMSEAVYAKRICGNITNIPLFSLRQKVDDLRDEIVKYTTKNPRSQLIIKDFPPGTISVGNLSAYIKKLEQSGIKPDVIMLDYINLLTGSVGTNSYEKVKHLTEQLRALSYEFAVPVITATQLNRSAVNQSNPQLETIGESYGLAMTADCMFNIWRTPEDYDMNRIKIGITKSRQGANFGHATFALDNSTLRIREESRTEGDDIVSQTETALSNVLD